MSELFHSQQLNVNVTFLIEGEEEAESAGMREALKVRIKWCYYVLLV